jgi:hypothetical protein
VQGSLARSLASRFTEGVRTGMAGETVGEPLTVSYEDLLLSLLLPHINSQHVSVHSNAREDILVAGFDDVGDFLDQVFSHAFGLLQECGCHVECWRAKEVDGSMSDCLSVVILTARCYRPCDGCLVIVCGRNQPSS